MDAKALLPYRQWIYLGLLVQVVAAWFSVGYHHPDEHYQILEFCNYKLGRSPLTDLPWEFAAKCRPGIQPFLAYGVSRLLMAIGLFNPFTVAFLLRLAMGLLTWWSLVRLLPALLPSFKTDKGRALFVGCSFFLWFVPYVGVRFSSETIAAGLFLLALSVLQRYGSYATLKKYAGLLVAGFLLGLSVFLRLQMGFALLGLAVWLLWQNKMPFKFLLMLCLGGGIALGVGAVSDHWLYGQWVFTPYNYFDVNIIRNVAAKFGTNPWWYYFVLFFNLAIPPLSIVLLFGFFAGVRKMPTHLLTLTTLTFLIGHFAIGHKELRFLFPACFPFLFLVCLGLESFMLKYAENKVYRFFAKLLVGVNLLVLVFKVFTPAEEVIRYYEFIYSYSAKQPTTIVSFTNSPFKLDVIECNFYKPDPLNVIVLKDTIALRELQQKPSERKIIYLSRKLDPHEELAGFKYEKLYCEYPDWLLKYNFNHWQDRSYIWAVYKILP